MLSRGVSSKDFKLLSVRNAQDARKLQEIYAKNMANEIIPFAINTPYSEIITSVMPDRDGLAEDGNLKHKVFICSSPHITTVGAIELCRKTKAFLDQVSTECDMEILSVCSGMEESCLRVVFMLRMYSDIDGGKLKRRLRMLYHFLGEDNIEENRQEPTLVIPLEAKRIYTEQEKKEHKKRLEVQNELKDSSNEIPFLNRIKKYEPSRLYEISPESELIYDMEAKEKQISTITDYSTFRKIFESVMNYATNIEKDSYYNVLRGKERKEEFMVNIEKYIYREFVNSEYHFPPEDVPALKSKANNALFELYIVQDLIDDPLITDIKIVDPHSIRVRVRGKAYLSNISFINDNDYFRFIKMMQIVKNLDLAVPVQRFTFDNDANYILRVSLTADYIMGSGYPSIHIRKHNRKKMMSDDLIRAGMMDEKIRDYLLDIGKSKSVVFAGAPGSGKTIMLNWFIEDAYESSAEILCIQETDELFSNRHGVMFEHVILNPEGGQRPCSLEELGQMALVAGANVFVIGEAKGGEICSAVTLANSGCRTAITIHSDSAKDTVDKMADLAMRGYATSYEQAKRMMKAFDIIVYLKDFMVDEITEIKRYDDEKKEMVYQCVYKNQKKEEL